MRNMLSALFGVAFIALFLSPSLATPTSQVTTMVSPPLAAPTSQVTTMVSRAGAAIAVPRLTVATPLPPAKITARQWARATRAARAYATRRAGRVRFVLITPTQGRRVFRPDEQTSSNSVIKAAFLVAYLRRASVRHRRLNQGDRRLLRPMIHISDNDSASRTLAIVGLPAVRKVGRLAGMKHFEPVSGLWGASQITARDQAKLFLNIDQLIPPRHRAFARRLLTNITPSQRWGIPRPRPRGWKIFFKGGWNGYGRVNQVALFTRGNERLSLAVLSDGPSHKYSIASIRGVAARILVPLRTP